MKKEKEIELEEETRPLEDDRVETSIVSEDIDLFDEVLGKKPKKKKETTENEEDLHSIVDKNEEDIIEDEEENSEEESEEDEDEETEEEEDENSEAEESNEKDKTSKKDKKTNAEDEEETEGEEDLDDEKENEENSEDKKGKEDKEKTTDDETEESEEDEELEEEEVDPTVDVDAKAIDSDEEIIEEDEKLIEEEEIEPKEEENEEEEENEIPPKEEIKQTILEKAANAVSSVIPVGEKLDFLEDKELNNVFIGRKANIFKKYGYEAALQLGRVKEQEHEGANVYLDSMNPHVVFVCGARGSGKSYVLGVVAEELAEKNKHVGVIVVDPIGVFWSMKFKNKEEREVEKLREWGMEPEGLSNLKVFIPEGVKKEVPKTTYDEGFAIQPSLLTGEDWSLTFGIDRFSVSGLLLDKVLKKVEKGYKQKETNKKITGKKKNYSIEDLIYCLETDSELNSRDKGYKPDSIRAISSRFEAAKTWGIFHEKGTPLGKLSREGQLTVLDTSFLDDNVTALVIGILARRLLSARKISTRKEAANKFKALNMDELLELEVPPTWLFIDEAHTLIPSGNEITPATAGLIEYVKQGRRPGLSLVFATQQPSAINTKVLSQLDIIMSHKLIFDDDIKAVFKRTPTIMPKKYRAPNFIKTLPVGVAVTGDRREETSRAFVMDVRPRKSQHEGRDAETTQMSESMEEEQVKKIAIELISRYIKEEKVIDLDKAKLALDTLNIKYGSNIEFEDLFGELEEKGFLIGEEKIMIEGYTQEEAVKELSGENDEEDEDENEEEEDEESKEENENNEEESEGENEEPEIEENTLTELVSLPKRISEENARRILEKIRKKKMFGLLGNSDRIESIQLKYSPIWKIKFDVMSRRQEFISRECFINSLTGELIHFKNGKFIESKGLNYLAELNEEEVKILKVLQKKELLLEEIMAKVELDEAKTRRVLKSLMEKGIATRLSDNMSDKKIYWLKEKLDFPPNESHELLASVGTLPFTKPESLSMEKETYSKESCSEALKKLWPSVIINKIEILHKPLWHIVLSIDAKERIVLIDAVNGTILQQ